MITRKEYIAAVTVVEGYHKQVEDSIAEIRNRPKTPILEFVQKVELSCRVRSAMERFMESPVEFSLEDINEFEFLKLRNTGRVSWKEFVEKREKYLYERRYL